MALQEKTFTYGGLYNTASRYFRTELTLREISTDPENNSSLLAYTLILYSGNTRLSGYRIGARIFLGGKEYVHRDGTDYANRVTITDQSSVTLCQGEITVPHNEDGTCKLSVSFSVYHPVVASYTPGNFTYTGGTMELTPIAKANGVFATDGYIGGVSMVAVHRKKQGHTHSLYYEMGEFAGYLTPEGRESDTEVIFDALNVPFAIPDRFYQAIPASKTGQCYLTCRTYSDGIFTGEAQTVFTVMTREDDCAPLLTASVRDGNEKTVALTGDENTLVRFASRAECTLEAASQKGAQIAETTIGDENATQLTVENAEKDSYRFCVTDSRGYRAERTVTAPFVPYVRLTAYPEAAWQDEQLILTVAGSYFSGSFGAAANSLTLFCLLPDGREVRLTPEIDGEAYRAEAYLEGLTPGQSLTVTATDAVMTVTETVSIPRAMPVFHWGENMFSVNVPASIFGVHMATASVTDSLFLYAPQGVLVCGAGVLGTADASGWQGTAGVTVTADENGELHIALPEGTQQVMFLSTGEMIIRK